MAKIADVIKYEGDNSTFIWKHPIEDFNALTQLVVHESQEAIFFRDGQALDLFGPGRYTLESQNIPLLGRILNRITGDQTPFHCEVYFINKTEQMSLKWGTDSKVQYIEPIYGFPVSIGACGELSLRVEDSRKLLLKLVGTESVLGQQQLISHFRAFLMTRVKTYIAHFMKENAVSIFEVDEHLVEFSDALKGMLSGDFADYGVSLERFFVTTILKPDGERQYETFKELHFRQYSEVAEAKLRQQVGIIDQQTQAQQMIIESQAMAAKRAQEGYTYQQERGFDVASQVAQNEAVGQFTNMGLGFGTMAGVGGAVGGMVSNMIGDALDGTAATFQQRSQEGVCANCGKPLPEHAKFCMECGCKVEQSKDAQIICPVCGKATAKGKFCMECGAPLVNKCPGCGATLQEHAKFCMECGRSIAVEN